MSIKFYDYTRETNNQVQDCARLTFHNSKFGTILSVEHLETDTHQPFGLETGFCVNDEKWHAFDVNGRMSAFGENSRNALIWHIYNYGVTVWLD